MLPSDFRALPLSTSEWLGEVAELKNKMITGNALHFQDLLFTPYCLALDRRMIKDQDGEDVGNKKSCLPFNGRFFFTEQSLHTVLMMINKITVKNVL